VLPRSSRTSKIAAKDRGIISVNALVEIRITEVGAKNTSQQVRYIVHVYSKIAVQIRSRRISAGFYCTVKKCNVIDINYKVSVEVAVDRQAAGSATTQKTIECDRINSVRRKAKTSASKGPPIPFRVTALINKEAGNVPLGRLRTGDNSSPCEHDVMRHVYCITNRNCTNPDAWTA
jgi:hypothetical protein